MAFNKTEMVQQALDQSTFAAQVNVDGKIYALASHETGLILAGIVVGLPSAAITLHGLFKHVIRPTIETRWSGDSDG